MTATDNADRYYKVMATGLTDRNPTAASAAFKAVAEQWMTTRVQACTLQAVMTATEVLFLTLLWRLNGDMSAPLTAAMMMTGVEYAFRKKLVDARSSQ